MKGVAIPYVVALLLGIIVLGIFVYMIYLHIVKNEPLDCSACAARFTTWCSKCFLLSESGSWSGGPEMDDGLKECVSPSKCNLYSGSGEDCTGAEDDCKMVGIPP